MTTKTTTTTRKNDTNAAVMLTTKETNGRHANNHHRRRRRSRSSPRSPQSPQQQPQPQQRARAARRNRSNRRRQQGDAKVDRSEQPDNDEDDSVSSSSSSSSFVDLRQEGDNCDTVQNVPKKDPQQQEQQPSTPRAGGSKKAPAVLSFSPIVRRTTITTTATAAAATTTTTTTTNTTPPGQSQRRRQRINAVQEPPLSSLPVSPFSPLLSRQRLCRSQRKQQRKGAVASHPLKDHDDDQDDNQDDQDNDNDDHDNHTNDDTNDERFLTNLSLSACRKVSVVVRVSEPDVTATTSSSSSAAASPSDQAAPPTDRKLCVFPLVTSLQERKHLQKQNKRDQKEATHSTTAPTWEALQAGAIDSRDVVVVNPTAFGKYIPSQVTMETAKVVAQVAHISSEDWARSFRFQQVVWPGGKRASNEEHQPPHDSSTLPLQYLCQAIVQDLTSVASIANRTVVALGSPERTSTLFGTVFQQGVAQVLAQAAPDSLPPSLILKRYGLLGLVVAQILHTIQQQQQKQLATTTVSSSGNSNYQPQQQQQQQHNNSNRTICTISILEIAEEDVMYDLLATRPLDATVVKLRYGKSISTAAATSNTTTSAAARGGATLTGLSDVPVDSLKSLGHLVRRALSVAMHKKRRTPRGHVIASVKVWENLSGLPTTNVATMKSHNASSQKDGSTMAAVPGSGGGSVAPSRSTMAQFIDLAVPEPPKSIVTTATGEALPTSSSQALERRNASVRKALAALGGVLRGSLLKEAGNDTMITYRESTLTKVLQRSIDHPDSRIVVLASLSPMSDRYEETMGTLRYVNRLLYRPGQPPQSPFDDPYHGAAAATGGDESILTPTEPSTGPEHTDMDTTSPTTTQPSSTVSPLSIEQYANHELLQNLLADPRQRLAKLIMKSSGHKKRGRGGTANDNDENGSLSGLHYVPTRYMEVDPGSPRKAAAQKKQQSRMPQTLSNNDGDNGVEFRPSSPLVPPNASMQVEVSDVWQQHAHPELLEDDFNEEFDYVPQSPIYLDEDEPEQQEDLIPSCPPQVEGDDGDNDSAHERDKTRPQQRALAVPGTIQAPMMTSDQTNAAVDKSLVDLRSNPPSEGTAVQERPSHVDTAPPQTKRPHVQTSHNNNNNRPSFIPTVYEEALLPTPLVSNVVASHASTKPTVVTTNIHPKARPARLNDMNTTLVLDCLEQGNFEEEEPSPLTMETASTFEVYSFGSNQMMPPSLESTQQHNPNTGPQHLEPTDQILSQEPVFSLPGMAQGNIDVKAKDLSQARETTIEEISSVEGQAQTTAPPFHDKTYENKSGNMDRSFQAEDLFERPSLQSTVHTTDLHGNDLDQPMLFGDSRLKQPTVTDGAHRDRADTFGADTDYAPSWEVDLIQEVNKRGATMRELKMTLDATIRQTECVDDNTRREPNVSEMEEPCQNIPLPSSEIDAYRSSFVETETLKLPSDKITNKMLLTEIMIREHKIPELQTAAQVTKQQAETVKAEAQLTLEGERVTAKVHAGKANGLQSRLDDQQDLRNNNHSQHHYDSESQQMLLNEIHQREKRLRDLQLQLETTLQDAELFKEETQAMLKAEQRRAEQQANRARELQSQADSYRKEVELRDLEIIKFQSVCISQDELTHEILQREKLVRSLQSKLDAATQQAQQKTEEHRRALELEKHRAELQAKRAEELQDQATRYRKSIERRNAELNKLQHESTSSDKLRVEFEQREIQIHELEAMLEESMQRAEHIKQESRHAVEMERQKCEVLTKNAQESQAMADRYCEDIAKKESQISKMQTELKAHRKLVLEIEIREKEIQRLELNLKAVKQQAELVNEETMQSLEAERKKADAQSTKARELHATAERFRREIEKKDLQILNLRSELSSHKDLMLTLQLREDEIRKIQSKLDEALREADKANEKTRLAIEGERERAEAQGKRADELQKEAEKYRQDIQLRDYEILKLQSTLSSDKIASQNMIENVTVELTAQREEVETLLKDAQNELTLQSDRHLRELKLRDDEILSLRESFAQASKRANEKAAAEIAEYRNLAEERSVKAHELELEIDRLRHEIERRCDETQELQVTIKATQQQLQTAVERNAQDLAAEKEKTESQKKRAQEELRMESERHCREVERQQDEIRDLREKLVISNQQAKEWLSSREEELISELESAKSRAKAERDALQNEIQLYREELTQKGEEILKLKDILTSAQRSKTDLEKSFEDLTSKHAKAERRALSLQQEKQDKISWLTDEVEIRDEKIQRLEQTVEQIRIDMQALQDESTSKLEEQRQKSEQRLRETTQELSKAHQRQMKERENEIDRLAESLRRISSDKVEVVKIAEEAIATQTELEAKVNELEHALESQRENTVSIEHAQELESIISTLKQEIEQARADIFQHKIDLNARNITISGLNPWKNE